MFKVDGKKGLKQPIKTHRQKQVTVTRTFRINAKWDEALREDAELRGISVNVLMNLILRRYANFDRLCRYDTSISMSKLGFGQLIENMPSDHLAKAGELTGPKDIQNIIDILGLPSNYDSFTYLLEKHYGGPNCAMWFNCFRHPQQKKEFFHLQHRLGRNWSIYLEKYFLSYLNTLGVKCDTRIYDYAVNFKILRS